MEVLQLGQYLGWISWWGGLWDGVAIETIHDEPLEEYVASAKFWGCSGLFLHYATIYYWMVLGEKTLGIAPSHGHYLESM